MPGRLPTLPLALAALAFVGCNREPLFDRNHPTVEVTFNDSVDALFARPEPREQKRWVAVTVRDVDGETWPAKAALRGFSSWHHGRLKPSLRLKPSTGRGLPEHIELSRPEDPLAICNWLPDQLAAGLGLLHEHSRPVRMLLDGREAGVYLRSLRPGDDLAAAAGRARGTWFKGDSLGRRRHLDLWARPAAWRTAGTDDPRATRALDELLTALRDPPSPASWQRLARALDLEAAAKVTALAALVGSIHADAVHNHVLFFDPLKDRLEPLLWDANGFGVHAEADLAVDVMRHPLAARLACHPEFVHRRNQLLWQRLEGPGSAEALLRTANVHLQQIDDVLRRDPEIAQLRLRSGVFEVEPLSYEQLPAAFAAFERFVRQREATLRAYFADARATIEPVAGQPEQSRVTVFGNVAVAATRANGPPPTAIDRRDAGQLLPGLSLELLDRRQHQAADGRGVSAPYAQPAPLCYVLACPPDELRLTNAFTGEAVDFDSAPPAREPRSLHPWDFDPSAGDELVLGPGIVHVDEPLDVPDGTRLRIARGTELHLLAPLRAFGGLTANGSPNQRIAIHCNGNGLTCIGGNVSLRHVAITDQAPWDTVDGAPTAMLSLRAASASLNGVQLQRAGGIALEIVGGEVRVRDAKVSRCHGTGVVATAGARLRLENFDVLYARRGLLATRDAQVLWLTGALKGHRIGVIADHGTVRLAQVTCSDGGQFDLDPRRGGEVQLINTVATANPHAAGQITREPPPIGTPATPR